MYFQAVERRFLAPLPGTPCIVLERRPWDDGGLKTLFHAYYVTAEGGETKRRLLGRVKILECGVGTPGLQGVFETVGDNRCSIGQEHEYYKNLIDQLGEQGAREVLGALRDLALLPDVDEAFKAERGYKTSLFRFPNAELALKYARGQLKVQAASPTQPLAFKFSCKLSGFQDEHCIDFAFPTEEKDKLGRIMAIAGRNGTGKTQLVARLAQVLSGLAAGDPARGTLEPDLRMRVAVVSFNAFDTFTTPRDVVPGGDYAYYGLRTPAARAEGSTRTKSDVDMDRAAFRLAKSIERIWTMGENQQGAFSALLQDLVLGNEPGLVDPFAEPSRDAHEVRGRIQTFVERLKHASAGHQLLVFIVTAVVESVRAKSVILLDEPETHLHPRLLSTLIRRLYEMLTERDAYAVIATHSPIVLQEIPGRSVQLIKLEGRYPYVRQYPGESFGESLDEIIRAAFGVQEEDRSYRTILKQLVDEQRERAEIEGLFDGLGLGAKLLLRELLEKRGGS